MTPPGGSGGDGNGHGVRDSNVLPFPQRGSSAAQDIHSSPPQSVGADRPTPSEPVISDPIGEPPASGPRSSLPPESTSFLNFPDFSVLSSLVQGQAIPTSGPFARLHTALRLLANPGLNQSFDVNFSRDGNHYRILQEAPGKEISILMAQDIAATATEAASQRPVYLLRYFPDGQVGYTASFDEAGKPQNLVTQPVAQLRRRAMTEHVLTLDFIENRLRHLNQTAGAFRRLEPLLQGLRGRSDVSSRSVWFDNYAVLDGKVYTIRTQNLGFPGFNNFPSQNQIMVFEQEGASLKEILRLSLTGEINYDPKLSVRQLATPSQLTLLERIIDQVQEAQQNPEAYQEKINSQLEPLRQSFPEHFQPPRIAIRPAPPPRTATVGTLGEPIHTITQGRDLLRMIRPWALRAHSHRWENPERPTEVRSLRPQGQIRMAMFKEFLRWTGNTLWHGAVDDHRNVKPDPGSLKLHLLPDGSADLEIFRNYERRMPDGRLIQESGIYNIIRRTSDKTTIDLSRVIKQMSKTNPDFANLPREQQVRLAARQITDSQTVPTSFELQQIPDLSLESLQVHSDPLQRILDQALRETPGLDVAQVARGPRTALQALEAIQRLPGMEGLKARTQSEIRGDLLREVAAVTPENYFLLEYPGGYPRTQVEILGEDVSGGKRVVIRMTQGNNQSTAVFDNGQFNPFESTRHNQALIRSARMGRARPHWLSVGLRGAARTYNYFQINGRAYFVGQLASLPLVMGFEHYYLNDREREMFGHPLPEASLDYVAHELFTAGTLFAGAGTGVLATDGIANFGTGMWRTVADWRRHGELTFRQAYRFNSPRILNPPPLLSRPIPRQAYYLRNFLQRGIPLITGLMAVDMYHRHSLTPDFGPQFLSNVAAVGTVSAGTSLFWAGMSHSLERQYARHGSETAFRGLSGALFRRNFVRFSPMSVGASRFSINFRATLLTVALEMAVLNIYGSYQRKQQFLEQEGDFRRDLSSALDRRNRIMTQLEHGEAIPPHEILASQDAVEGAYERYHRFLEIIDPRESTVTSTEIPLTNAYSEAHSSYQQTRLALGGSDGSPALAQAQYDLQRRLGTLRDQEAQLERRVRQLHLRHGIPHPDAGQEESLTEFLTRTVSAHQAQLSAGEGTGTEEAHPEQGTIPSGSPVTLDSTEGQAIIEHLNWKMGEDTAFAMASPQVQARFILAEFSGYRVSDADGHTRPWNEGEALAFLAEVDLENRRRLNRLETPLTSAAGSNAESVNPELIEMAAEEDQIHQEIFGRDPLRLQVEQGLANNISDLERQMESYHRRTDTRIDQAIVQFIPPELFEPGNASTEETGPLAWASSPPTSQARSLLIR